MNFAVLTSQGNSARIPISELIVNDRDYKRICYLEGFGPASEVRSFAQLLENSSASFTIDAVDGEQRVSFMSAVDPACTIKLLPLQNDYLGIVVLPSSAKYLVAENKDDLFTLFSRLLDQTQFCCRNWYRDLFDEMPILHPWLGNKLAMVCTLSIPKIVQQKLASGLLAIPPTEHHIEVKIAEKVEEQEEPAQ